MKAKFIGIIIKTILSLSLSEGYIFCDSRVVIDTIAKLHDLKTNRGKKVQDEINNLQQNNNSITIQWILSHCGLREMKEQTYWPKKGSTIMQIRKPKILYFGIKMYYKL